MSVECLYGHARDRARAYTCARDCARARPQVVQPEFRSNTKSSC